MIHPPIFDQDILDTIPHRPPFLFIQNIESLVEGDHLVARMFNEPDAAYYAGHFPGLPVMPGVLILEALAQASCYLFAKTMRPPAGSRYYLGNIKSRFLNAATSADVIRLHVKNKRVTTLGGIFEIAASTDSQELTAGEIGFICKHPEAEHG